MNPETQPPSAPPSPTTPADEGRPSREARQMAMLAHLSPLIVSILGPLLIWLLKREDDPFIDDQGKEALNFHLSLMLYIMVCVPLIFVGVGVLLLLGVGVGGMIFSIIAGIKANEGERYRYPLTIRFIR